MVALQRGDRLILSVGRSGREFEVPPEAVALLAGFAVPSTLDEGLRMADPAARRDLRRMFAELRAARIVIPQAAGHGTGPWDALDLALHRQLNHRTLGTPGIPRQGARANAAARSRGPTACLR